MSAVVSSAWPSITDARFKTGIPSQSARTIGAWVKVGAGRADDDASTVETATPGKPGWTQSHGPTGSDPHGSRAPETRRTKHAEALRCSDRHHVAGQCDRHGTADR